jgi:hypothetical protein
MGAYYSYISHFQRFGKSKYHIGDELMVLARKLAVLAWNFNGLKVIVVGSLHCGRYDSILARKV